MAREGSGLCMCDKDAVSDKKNDTYALVMTAAIVSGTMVGGMGGRYVPWPTCSAAVREHRKQHVQISHALSQAVTDVHTKANDIHIYHDKQQISHKTSQT